MPDITLPHRAATTIQDTNTVSGENIAENFYSPNTTPDSLEVINGQLQHANRDTSAVWTIDRTMIQPGALSGGKATGSSLSLDYFGKTDTATTSAEGFSHADWHNVTNDNANLYRAIPGASIAFYLPYTPEVFIATWRIFVSHTGVQTDGALEFTVLKLFRDDVPAANQVRTLYPAGTASAADRGLEWDRTWAGHFWDDGTHMTKGWHKLSLRIATATELARVHCKGIDFVYFK